MERKKLPLVIHVLVLSSLVLLTQGYPHMNQDNVRKRSLLGPFAKNRHAFNDYELESDEPRGILHKRASREESQRSLDSLISLEPAKSKREDIDPILNAKFEKLEEQIQKRNLFKQPEGMEIFNDNELGFDASELKILKRESQGSFNAPDSFVPVKLKRENVNPTPDKNLPQQNNPAGAGASPVGVNNATQTEQGPSLQPGADPVEAEDNENYTSDKDDQQTVELEETDEDADVDADQFFTLFTIANTDIGVEYDKVPYRERYLWDKRDAPCHSFNLKIPDEMEEKSVITLCIFRPALEFPDETKLFILDTGSDDPDPPPPNKVFGYVMNTAVSSVYGRIVDRLFYGEVSIFDESSKSTTIYVVEEIHLLNRLMRNNQKTLKHMLMVMHGRGKDNVKTVFNAVVTKGASLIDFMVFSNPTDINRNAFIMFSTNHNSYICSGEPLMHIDENGQLQIETGSNKILVENDGSVRMTTNDKTYTFRPHGRTIVTEGMVVRTLQEHEGSVAITAFSSASSYDCVLPTPVFQTKRKGGYVCKVCVAMDDLFKKHFIPTITNDTETASNYLGHIIDRVSWILRSIDFDDDKRPDNVGLDYDTQSLRWTYPEIANEELREDDIEILFRSLSLYDFEDCCLGIGFTMKNFPESDFARRPPQAEKIVGPTGVCSGRTGRIPNNLIIISANNKNGSYSAITEDQLIYVTAQQVVGAFGAPFDGTGDDVCDQFIDDEKKPRHYLMWSDVIRNTTTKEQSLSSCSKKEMVKTLSTCKSSCFDVDRHPFCGNGIVEDGEECDCGSEYNCELQTCCFSRVGKHPCRKSGIGCQSSASPSLSLTKGLSVVTFGLLTMSTFNLRLASTV